MGNTARWMNAAALGAGIMYFMDPDRGKRRRALVRDKAKRMATVAARGADKARRDLVNRRRGAAAAIAAHIPFRADEPPGYILEARVRSKIGRLVSHPHRIDVTTHRGVVTLHGDVLTTEARRLIAGVSRISGVTRVDNQMQAHENESDFPGLKKDTPKTESRPGAFHANWSPAARLLTLGVGGTLMLYGMWRRGIQGMTASMAGAGMMTRALTNMELSGLLGARPGQYSIDICKTIKIAAPVEKVYEFWSSYENFPQFMAHLKEVRETSPGRSHWIANGRGGIKSEWDAEITHVVPNQLLAWRSLPGSPMENEGQVRFDPNEHGGTRLTVRIFYRPPAGAAGHLLAKLLGSDPKHALNEDLIRLKSLLEVGKTRAHGEVVMREKLPGLGTRKTLVAAAGASQQPGWVH